MVIDHIGKDDRGPIGASQKTARISGASLQCTVVEPLARGRTGIIKVTIDKDRPEARAGAAKR